MTPNNITNSTAWLVEPPDRQVLLTRSYNNTSRQQIIIQRANWLIQAVDNVEFREYLDEKDLECQPYFVTQQFIRAKEIWNKSRDRADLGPLFHADKVEMPEDRGMAQYAAALTVAEDEAVLGGFGFKIADWRHGVQEGFVAVDEHTFVLAVSFGDRVQQVVCETARPTAMIWAKPETACEFCINYQLHLSPTPGILRREYCKTQPSFLRGSWDPGHVAELVVGEEGHWGRMRENLIEYFGEDQLTDLKMP
ncbi:hypothetical protein DL769_003835 [Monosporascus sp. CRB-8-3]|nr:hypothetical protein DL769_003835 [Monosporascus sp. CRB-8-3]